jgi:hypothetical protein
LRLRACIAVTFFKFRRQKRDEFTDETHSVVIELPELIFSLLQTVTSLIQVTVNQLLALTNLHEAYWLLYSQAVARAVFLSLINITVSRPYELNYKSLYFRLHSTCVLS